MSPALVPIMLPSEVLWESTRFDELRRTVLNGVAAENSKRNYALALDELRDFSQALQQPVSRALLLAFRADLLARNLSAVNDSLGLS